MSPSRKRSVKNSVPGKADQPVPELKAPIRPNSPASHGQSPLHPVVNDQIQVVQPESVQLQPQKTGGETDSGAARDDSDQSLEITLTPDSNPEEFTVSRSSPAATIPESETPARDIPSEAINPEVAKTDASTPPRQHPIPPPSEPMQYRAIGLVRGRYVPSEEQLTQGVLHLADGPHPLPSVLLGRVMSLVKNHLNLERDYLWVVYPRVLTKPRTPETLCFQIVGVWDPALLNRLDQEDSETVITPAENPLEMPEPENGYFSIRGEVIGFSEENQEVMVTIRQLPRKPNTEGKSFKLPLKGTLSGKILGHFWDLDVKHENGSLFIRSGSCIGFVAPKKRNPQAVASGKPAYNKKPAQPSGTIIPPTPRVPSERPAEPVVRREPLAKPMKKPRS